MSVYVAVDNHNVHHGPSPWSAGFYRATHMVVPRRRVPRYGPLQPLLGPHPQTDPLAPPQLPFKMPQKYHLIETLRPLIEVNLGVDNLSVPSGRWSGNTMSNNPALQIWTPQ